MTKNEVLLRWRVLLSRITGFFSADTKLHKARFARLHELKNLLSDKLNEKPSLLLGISRFNQVLRVQPTEARKELGNVLDVGPSRCGKSSHFEGELYDFPYSIIANDIKGELSTRTAGFRASRGPVYFLDPTGWGHRYDPLLGKNTEDEFYSAATHLLYKSHEGEGKAFTDRAINMLTQLFLAAGLEGQSPLPYVRKMVRSGLVGVTERLQAVSPDLATQFLEIQYDRVDFSDKYLTSSWGTLSAAMRPILTETVVKSLAGADFSMRDVMCGEKPVTIYLRWPERDLLTLAPLVKLIWGTFISELTAIYDNAKDKRKCRPVLLLVDEAGVTPIPELHKYVATVNGRGISFMLAIQALSQLDALYGKYNANTIRNNMDSQIYYRQADFETAQYLEKRLGDKSGFATSHTLHDGAETSAGESEREIPLMSAQEIMQLKDEEIICFHRGLPPFRVERMDWRRFPLLEHRQHVPPPPLPILPPLDEHPPDQVWGSTKPESSWRLDPGLIRRRNQPAAVNGLRENISHDGEAGFRP